jgi:hypothetical protein
MKSIGADAEPIEVLLVKIAPAMSPRSSWSSFLLRPAGLGGFALPVPLATQPRFTKKRTATIITAIITAASTIFAKVMFSHLPWLIRATRFCVLRDLASDSGYSVHLSALLTKTFKL